MDDTTPTSADQHGPQAARPATGTGWSSPASDRTTQSTPWRESGNDTGAIPRPNDTRQIPGNPAADASNAAPSSAGSTDPTAAAGPANPAGKSRRSTAAIAALALGAGLIGGAAGAGIYAAVDDDTITPVRSLDNEPAEATDAADLSSVADVAANVTPSVVSISVRGERGVGSGSGVVISSDGQILTNAHVADAAGDEGRIIVTFADGSDAEAEVVGSDEQSDVAIIQAQGVSGLQTAELGDSDALDVGEELIAFGSPLGLDGTVTRGIVSALHRPVQAGDASGSDTATLFEAIQTDASINPGNSGGPLVNMAGQVVGINTAIATSPGTLASGGSIGLGFAIPINTARYIAEQLVAGDEVSYARIGIGVNDGDGPDAAATVAEVQDSGAAEGAGLEEGDVITHIDGRFIADATSLVAAARSFEPGDVVSLTYVRDGEENTVEITLGTSADDE